MNQLWFKGKVLAPPCIISSLIWKQPSSSESEHGLSRSQHFIVVMQFLFFLILCSHVIMDSFSAHPKEPSWVLANEKCCNSRNASPLADGTCSPLAVKQILISECLIYCLIFFFLRLSQGCRLVMHVIHSHSKTLFYSMFCSKSCVVCFCCCCMLFPIYFFFSVEEQILL